MNNFCIRGVVVRCMILTAVTTNKLVYFRGIIISSEHIVISL